MHTLRPVALLIAALLLAGCSTPAAAQDPDPAAAARDAKPPNLIVFFADEFSPCICIAENNVVDSAPFSIIRRITSEDHHIARRNRNALL